MGRCGPPDHPRPQFLPRLAGDVRRLGNLPPLPQTAEELPEFYDLFNGGDPGRGRPLNPRTDRPYPAQIVPCGDYTRVLAEFWADGPNSDTPPGH